MKNNQRFKNVNMCIILFTFACLTYNTAALKILGFGVVVLMTILSVMMWANRKKYTLNAKLGCVIFSIIALYLIALVRKPTVDAIESLLLFLVSIIVLVVYLDIDLRKIDIKLVKRCIGIHLIILYIPVLLGQEYYNIIDGGYKSIYTTTTFLGIFSCMCAEICYLIYAGAEKKKIWLIYMILYFNLVWSTKVRTALIGMIALVLYIIGEKIATDLFKKDIIYRVGKWVVYVAIVGVTLIYPNLDRFSWFNSLQEFVYVVTGKILMSGRNQIWKNAFSDILESPLFGYGLDFSHVFSGQIHNSYLQIMMQTGILGIILVFLLINYTFSTMLKCEKEICKKILLCSLINILMCTTEVMLLQGQIILQIVMWGMLAIGINVSIGKKVCVG